jgi:hypothetical protein
MKIPAKDIDEMMNQIEDYLRSEKNSRGDKPESHGKIKETTGFATLVIDQVHRENLREKYLIVDPDSIRLGNTLDGYLQAFEHPRQNVHIKWFGSAIDRLVHFNVLHSSLFFNLQYKALFEKAAAELASLNSSKISSPKSNIEEIIESVVTKSREEDFKGDGFEPISDFTKSAAIALANNLAGLPIPKVSAYIEGRISFKWRYGKNAVLVTLGDDRKLIFSSLVNNSELFGDWDFDGKLPLSVRDRILEATTSPK